MATVTVTGTVGGVPISILTSTALQTALAQQILASATANSLITGPGGALATSVAIDITPTSSLITGLPGVIASQVILDGQFGTYVTGSTATPTASTSIVVGADFSNSSIVNNNPIGGLIAVTGAGGNVVLGLTGQNVVVTGNGGQDLVVLNGAANSLTTNGADAVIVGGPSTITAAASGLDNILVTTGTTLSFINGSQVGVDTITGAANAKIVVAGSGATSVTAAGGPEAFFVDTSVGNVTLNSDPSANDAFTFVKSAATTPGAAQVLVRGFNTGDVVNVHGYAGIQFSVAQVGSGAVLSLTDGSSVTFSTVSAATVAAAVKIV